MCKKSGASKKLLCAALTAVLLFSCILFPSPLAGAESLESLRSKYEELEKSIAENQEKLDGIETDIAGNEEKLKTISAQVDSIQEQIEVLNTRISTLNGSIETLQPQIDSLTTQIGEAEKTIAGLEEDIAEAEDSIEETKDALLTRIREDYMSGGGATTLEVLLTSKNLRSFFARMELMQCLSESDSKLIGDFEKKATELVNLKKDANEKKAALEESKSLLDEKMSTLQTNKSDLETSKAAQETKQAELNSSMDEVSSLLTQLGEDSEAYRNEIARQHGQMNIIADQIDAFLRRNGSKKGDSIPQEYVIRSSSSGLIWPIPYENTAISCHYGYYSDGTRHWGTDIVIRDGNGNNISEGKDIVAAQSGIVILAISNDNYNYGYGNYCIIDHGNGMMTLYCHCKRVIVSQGQVVSQGQKIAEIGLTGHTFGYHLHFEVRIKNADGSIDRVNPENYVSKP